MIPSAQRDHLIRRKVHATGALQSGSTQWPDDARP